jgi:hypothetical protein
VCHYWLRDQNSRVSRSTKERIAGSAILFLHALAIKETQHGKRHLLRTHNTSRLALAATRGHHIRWQLDVNPARRSAGRPSVGRGPKVAVSLRTATPLAVGRYFSVAQLGVPIAVTATGRRHCGSRSPPTAVKTMLRPWLDRTKKNCDEILLI